MSLKEARFVNPEQNDTEPIVVDVTKSGVSFNDNRFYATPKDNVNLLTEKVFNWNLNKAEISMYETGKTIVLRKMTDDTFVFDSLLSCTLCQNHCVNCKQRCVTCKYPCFKCNSSKNFKNSSTDTDDFENYLESHLKKIKILPKLKTTGTDTCDLEGHFDYYKLEKKEIRIQKHVATDCSDLNVTKYVFKKPNKKTIATDTNDLFCSEKTKSFNENKGNFFWKSKDESKINYEKNMSQNISMKKEEKCENNVCENSLVIDEESNMFNLFKGNEDNKENLNLSMKEIMYDCSSTSDESDIDVITSCKLSKCRQLARMHKISIKQITKDSKTYYKCSLCEKTFPKKYLCVLHLGNHIDGNTFKCLTCDEQYISLNMLFNHVQKNHFSSNDSFQKTDETEVNLNNENKENTSDSIKKNVNNKLYQCTLCVKENESPIQFKTSKALYLHKKIEHGVNYSKASKERGKGEKKVRVKREFVCLLCGKQFRNSKALEDHHPVHTGEKNYLCDICNKFYSTSANLTIHKRTHLGTKNFVCTVCNKAFHKKDSLKVHFRKHSGERPFQCDLCPMKFDRNYILKNHRYTHFSERTFICPVCGKTFSTNGGLSNHEKSHKKDPLAKKPRKPAVKPTLDTEKAVICDICGKIYSTKSNLRIHKFIHTGLKPFKCTICHQTYAKKDSLLTHMRKHTDERPFACETCGMTFYRNHTLKTHVLRHTGEKPHKCKICGKSFTQSSSLRYHIKNHDKKIERKKVITNELGKTKKKRVKTTGTTTKKVSKPVKLESEFQIDELKPVMESKKLVETSSELITLKNSVAPVGLSEKLEDFSKGGHFMLPVGEQEIFILDKNLSVELPKSKDIDYFSLEKDSAHPNQFSVSKFNYYIAKSHVFSFPKDATKIKGISKDIDISIEKNDDHSKSTYITKDGNSIALNENSSLKEIKEEYLQISDQRLNLKPQATIPITGEILNATFISDENGDMIPFNPMTLQGLVAENLMISPVISLENDEKKSFLKNPRLSVIDSKIMYNIMAPRTVNEKISENKNCNVINLKDGRIPPKINIDLDSPSLHIQTPVVDDGINGITSFYPQSSVQENEI